MNKGWSAVVNIGFCVKIGFVNIGSIILCDSIIQKL